MTTETNVERLKRLSRTEGCLVNGDVILSESDFMWLIKRAKMLQWIKEAILICNEEDMSPKELARLLDKSNL